MKSQPKKIARKPRKHRIDVARRAEIGQEKRARTRTAILKAAFVLLGHERGLMTSTDEICKAANISRGTLYNHFTGMEDLLDSLSYELNHDFNQAVLAALTQIDSAAERSAMAIRHYLERARKDPQWAWTMVNISAGGAPTFGKETADQTQLTVTQGIASGEFDLPGPISGRDLLLGTTLHAMVTQLHNSPSSTFPSSVAMLILRGLGIKLKRIESILAKPLVPLA